MRRTVDTASASYATVRIVRNELSRRKPCRPPPDRPHHRRVARATGFESLENEVRVDSLPLEGELPDWLTGSLVRTGPAKWEVGERSMNHWFDGLAMLHRFCFADGAVSYASRFLETQRLPRRARDRRDHLLRVRDRPLPLAVPARRVDVLAEALRQRERQPGQARRALHRDDRDADPGRVRRRDARDGRRRLRGPGDADHRAPAPRPRDRRDAQLRRQARPAQRVPLLPPRARTPTSPR